MIVSTWLKVLIVFLWSAAAVRSAVLRGPDNVLGIVHDDVTLKCRSDPSQEVEWKFTRIGQTTSVDKSQFPGGDVSTVWTASGYHSLTLTGVEFQNAGRYECRVVETSEVGRDAEEAYVVVVADPPHCKRNVTDAQNVDFVGLECSVTFLGQHNVTLEWLAPNSEVLTTDQYWSGDVPQVARLRLTVKLQTVWSTYNTSTHSYTCRASFGNTSAEFFDVANNAPRFQHNACTVRLPPAPSTVPQTDTASTLAPQPVHRTQLELALIVLLVGLLIIVIVVIIVCACLCRAKLRSALRRVVRRQRESSENSRNSARCDTENNNNDADASVATILMQAQDEPGQSLFRPALACSDETTTASAQTPANPSTHDGFNLPREESTVSTTHSDENGEIALH